MPILLFLIDTSASMNQRSHLGTTYLDTAKGAVETFMKLRARDPASRGDRYMLVTFEEPPYAIKVTALALPLPFLPSLFLPRSPSPPPHSPFIMLPSPTRRSRGRPGLFPCGLAPPPPLGSVLARRGVAGPPPSPPRPGPARPCGGGGGGAAINMADISPPRRERQQ
uniref:VWFA domain-containing protein n=1 Tax=Castor canadensis TaxID=51338 RepID=A0A8C0XGM2_CASCN